MPALAQPFYMLAAAAGAALVVALHLLAWRRPTPVRLPTTRFVPPSAVRAVSRAIRPTDLLLLAVRVLALLLAGLALARPVFTPARSGTARVLVVDASRRVASVSEAIDSARAYAAGVDESSWVRVDSAATVFADSIPSARSTARGALGAGMVAAVREARRLARTRDSVEIVVVSPFAAESWSAAMASLRDEWGGRVRVIRLPLAEGDAGAASGPRTGGRSQAVLPPVDDPVGAAFALAIDSAASPLRVVRDTPTADDSSWAREGGVLVWWPRTSRPDRERSDSVTSPANATILAGSAGNVAGHFAPLDGVPGEGEAILRWSDGAAAATELPLASGCVRSIAIALPESGDEVLRPGFVRLVRSLAEPCGGGNALAVPDSVLSRWVEGVRGAASPGAGAGAGGSTAEGEGGDAELEASPGARSGANARARAGAAVGSSPGSRVSEGTPPSPTLTRALLAAVALLLLAEWWLRRTRAGREVSVTPETTARREAA